MSNYENLEVWKRAHSFALKIYKITLEFPKEEKFAITSQLRRAALSIPTNIVEGKGSSYTGKLIRFLDIAKGSAQEVEYLLLFCKDLEYISNENYCELKNECEEILKMLTGFIKFLNKKTTESFTNIASS